MTQYGFLLMIAIRISPNARKSEILGWFGEEIKIKIAAPAVDGKANQALIHFLSKSLGISQADITIVRGHTSRSKIIQIPQSAETKLRQLVK